MSFSEVSVFHCQHAYPQDAMSKHPIMTCVWALDLSTLSDLQAAVAAVSATGALFVSSAGNDDNNNDISPHWPSNIETDTTISVAALDRSGQLWYGHPAILWLPGSYWSPDNVTRTVVAGLAGQIPDPWAQLRHTVDAQACSAFSCCLQGPQQLRQHQCGHLRARGEHHVHLYRQGSAVHAAYWHLCGSAPRHWHSGPDDCPVSR